MGGGGLGDYARTMLTMSRDIFAVIYFRGLQNWTMLEQC